MTISDKLYSQPLGHLEISLDLAFLVVALTLSLLSM